jgi:hypothetical protein
MATRRKTRIPITRTVSEEVAISICRTLNHGCPCEHAPSVCDIMVRAGRKALMTGAPEFAEKIFEAERAAARR